jgi:predicted O-linked N-acetylglucosamine transferase (SPINDLY family)
MTIQQQLQLAVQHHQAGRLPEAESAYGAVLAQEPDHAEALHLLGVVMSQSARHAEAVALIRRAIAIHATDPQYHVNLALALRRAGDAQGAVDAYDKAIELSPALAKAHGGRGIALGMLGRHAEAADALGRAIGLSGAAATAETYGFYGAALAGQGRLDDAADAFRKSVARDPSEVRSYAGLADAQWRSGLVAESLETTRAALRVRPDPDVHSSLLFTMSFSPGETQESILREHLRFDELYARALRPSIRPHANRRDPDRRLRVGYVSADFRNHVLALYAIPLLAAHDRRNVEVFCYSHAPEPDHLTPRFRALADTWRETRALDDEQAAELIRADGIDVLVDLGMHMAHARPLIFARKPAPVQVAWFAYPGTTGLGTMDYRLSDPYLDPPGSEAGKYAEQTVRLPHTFWCIDPAGAGDEPVGAEPPAAANGFVTFGCLNNFAKVNDGVLSLWSRVLAALPGARLLMLAPEGRARVRVLDRLGAGGVADADTRVEFVPFARGRRRYLRQYHRIDIALDTIPYNGHTTSMDAMWMGVPVVTLVGQTIVGRAGWSQLNNLGLIELAAHDEAGFVRIATELAGDLARLGELRRSLRDRMRASPLVDAARFARDMEAAYRDMWRGWCGS